MPPAEPDEDAKLMLRVRNGDASAMEMLVIDGGFSKAYQPETGIAGYTLVYHSRGIIHQRTNGNGHTTQTHGIDGESHIVKSQYRNNQ